MFKVNEIDAISKVAKSKASANRVAKALASHQIKSAISNLQSALKAAEAREAEKDNKRRAANIKKLSSMMAKMGLSPSDITGKASRKPGRKNVKRSKTSAKSKVGPNKGTKVAPKYTITSEGKTHQWTGRGRMPLIFKAVIDQGGSLEQYLI
jgi:DNA-binding protein H-NS